MGVERVVLGPPENAFQAVAYGLGFTGMVFGKDVVYHALEIGSKMALPILEETALPRLYTKLSARVVYAFTFFASRSKFDERVRKTAFEAIRPTVDFLTKRSKDYTFTNAMIQVGVCWFGALIFDGLSSIFHSQDNQTLVEKIFQKYLNTWGFDTNATPQERIPARYPPGTVRKQPYRAPEQTPAEPDAAEGAGNSDALKTPERSRVPAGEER